MANIRLIDNTWDTSGIYDSTEQKTQDQINATIPAVDSTLAVSGDAADAKATGDALATKVPTTRTVAGKALSSDVSLAAGDIAYDPSGTYGNNTLGSWVKEHPGIFWCTYGTTTYEEVMAAVDMGLLPCVVVSNLYLPPSEIPDFVNCLAVYTSKHSGSYTKYDGSESGTFVSAVFMSIGNRSFNVHFEKYTITSPSYEVRDHWAVQELPAGTLTQYDSTNKKLINHTSIGNSNIVTVAKLKEDMGLGSITLTNAGSI